MPAPSPQAEPSSYDLDGTAAFDAQLLAKEIMPFEDDAPGDPVPSTPAPTNEPDQAGETAFVQALRDDELPGFVAGPASQAELPATGAPELSLEQYASLCAERSQPGADAADIMHRYGAVDSASAGALDGLWQGRFFQDRDLKTRFDQLVAHYRQWLSQNNR